MGLEALTNSDIERLHADPPLVWLIVAPDDPEVYQEERAKEARGLFGKLFGKKPDDRPIASQFSCDLDKAWNGVSYLFTGTAGTGNFPLDFLIRDSRSVGDIDIGYGQARTFSSQEMLAVHEAMSPFTDEVLEARFNGPDMMAKEVYPEIWDQEDSREWLVDAAKELRAFLAACAEKGLGCLVYLT